MARFAPVWRGNGGSQADSLRAVSVILVLIWNDELGQGGRRRRDVLLADARRAAR